MRAGRDFLQRAMDTDVPADENTDRILGAALEQAEDFGLRRFTIDDVARRVGLSRVTIYRYFAKKDQLLNALIMRELRRFLTKADAVIAAQPTPEAKLVEGLTFCVTFLRGHRLLTRLLRTEPEFLLPYLTVKAGDFLAAARNWIAGHIRAEVVAGRVALPDEDIDAAAELLARNVLSLVLTPETVLPLDSPEGRQRLVDLYFVPIVRAMRP
ncbi:TetR/AcrR family transcriptional regulator [Actinocrispum wychmicini]|uniref:TetR family transcriptional regulator n=1 Tax=Actinocrispum wychmicini TaxID=1213861 RepID=A0A4R2J7J0_9PSEU|nr:TetR/AcrR family transcriptional regulator [Actinocrispum wychmicini]TCO55083.1 TetR family transcriptional regulator [Actinocrispum wychmicini]